MWHGDNDTVGRASGQLTIPWLSRVANLGKSVFPQLAAEIDSLPPKGREWSKIPILMSSLDYLNFVALGTGSSTLDVSLALADFADDSAFMDALADRLTELDHLEAPGDLRFHAITLYLAVRLTKPSLVVETGVAHGKSSAFILGALERNGFGRLVSFDLAPDGHLSDGSRTRMSGRRVGWLVPPSLATRWTLRLEDSLIGLEQLVRSLDGGCVDIFLHDSLHTYDHTLAELSIVCPHLSPRSIVAVDNIDMPSGRAFSDLLSELHQVGFAFRDFGLAQLEITGRDQDEVPSDVRQA